MEQQSPATPPAPEPSGWAAPPAPSVAPPNPMPAPQASGWAVAPAPAAGTRGGVTGYAKVGAMILFLNGVFWLLVGLIAILAGEVVRSLIEGVAVEGLTQGQVSDLVGGAIAAVGIVIAAVALIELVTGIFAWRGSDFARVVGILYGLFFGLIMLLSAAGASRAASEGARGLWLPLAFAVAYLYTAVVFIFRFRTRA